MQKILISLLTLLLLTACAHKVEVQQGNVVTRETLAKVKVGMDQRQVRFLLGSPLLVDPFHQNRWEYYYSLEQEGDLVRSYRVSLHFKGNRLVKIDQEGEIPASELPFATEAEASGEAGS